MPQYCDEPFNVIVHKITDKAALLEFVDLEEEIWIPLSQIENGDDLEEDDEWEAEIYLTEWIANQKGLL
jgi:hypothetical protein